MTGGKKRTALNWGVRQIAILRYLIIHPTSCCTASIPTSIHPIHFILQGIDHYLDLSENQILKKECMSYLKFQLNAQSTDGKDQHVHMQPDRKNQTKGKTSLAPPEATEDQALH